MQAIDRNRPLPQGATDTHVHVFAPAQFPFAQPRSYTPGAAPVQVLSTW